MVYSNIQNPAIGSYIIYKFVKGYNNNSDSNVCFPLIFLALPFVFNKKCRDAAVSTRISSGLFGILKKVSNGNRNNDVKLLSKRAKNLMQLSFDAFVIALSTDLVKIDYDNDCVLSAADIDESHFDEKTLEIGHASYNFGATLSKHSVYEISAILNVRF